MHPKIIFIPRVPGVSRRQRGNCIHTQVPSAAPKLEYLGYLYSRIILYSIDHILCPVELSVRLVIIHLSWTEITVRVFFFVTISIFITYSNYVPQCCKPTRVLLIEGQVEERHHIHFYFPKAQVLDMYVVSDSLYTAIFSCPICLCPVRLSGSTLLTSERWHAAFLNEECKC
ncbi:hypothetical protein CPB84DRAFT_1799953 [Gymnopilus junonius]|uniref:Uncharacterized protein n=1 Tax=Gymnopilus junonius TaxID=109634 RepID=A0A9P5TG46_GYMJU|nr:hypothetical protein CPB84DRAFT_1799953 [Gymnopilus junonius]